MKKDYFMSSKAKWDFRIGHSKDTTSDHSAIMINISFSRMEDAMSPWSIRRPRVEMDGDGEEVITLLKRWTETEQKWDFELMNQFTSDIRSAVGKTFGWLVQVRLFFCLLFCLLCHFRCGR